VGKVLQQARDTIKTLTPGSINPGSAGANQTWNFVTLLSDTVDTLTFTNPTWTPHGSSFPNSNLAVINSSDGSVTYLENTSTGLFVDGAYTNPMGQGFMTVTINPTEELSAFADTFNSSFQKTSRMAVKAPFTQYPGADSVWLKERKAKDVKTDGWGSVITPLGTYNCIRHKGRVITVDSIFIHIASLSMWINAPASYSPIIDTVWHFSWWASGVGFPLVEFDSTKADTIRNITWLKTLPVIGGIHETASLSEVNAYPNPSSGQFTFYSPQTTNYGLEIYNVIGECIFQKTVNRNSSAGASTGETVNLNAPNGIYFLHITSKEGTAIRKLVISK
jgi:hypothetical protein